MQHGYAIRGHRGAIHLVAEGGHAAWFYPRRPILTGARHRNGRAMRHTASTLARYLQLDLGRNVGDRCEVPSMKGVFDPITVIDIRENHTRVYGLVPTAPNILAGAFD